MSRRHFSVAMLAVLAFLTGSVAVAAQPEFQNHLWTARQSGWQLDLGAWPFRSGEGLLEPHRATNAEQWPYGFGMQLSGTPVRLEFPPSLDDAAWRSSNDEWPHSSQAFVEWQLATDPGPPRRIALQGLGLLGLGVGVHAALANSSLDEEFRESFREHVVGEARAFGVAKGFGETWVVVPALVSIYAADQLLDMHGGIMDSGWRHEVGDWSSQCLQALLVGGIQTGLLQLAIGASRPGELQSRSSWRPFDDDNGVSGHATLGAIPFLVAAKRTDNALLKSALLVGSGMTGYSRIYDDAHYLSQVMLGWWVAFLAVEATEMNSASSLSCQVVSLSVQDVVGVGLEFRR